MIGIYKITNPTGRIYIGQSTNIEERRKKYEKLYCKDQPSIYNSLKKYGFEQHKFEIMEECLAEQLDEREIYWGEYYNVLSNKHLNNRLGRGFGSYDSEETKKKKSESNKGISRNKGNVLSQEHKAKISQSKKGKKYNITKIRKDKNKPRTYHVSSVIEAKSKPILQYDLRGNFIKEWKSGAVAAKELNIPQPNINSCCNGKINSSKGYIWKFKTI